MRLRDQYDLQYVMRFTSYYDGSRGWCVDTGCYYRHTYVDYTQLAWTILLLRPFQQYDNKQKKITLSIVYVGKCSGYWTWCFNPNPSRSKCTRFPAIQKEFFAEQRWVSDNFVRFYLQHRFCAEKTLDHLHLYILIISVNDVLDFLHIYSIQLLVCLPWHNFSCCSLGEPSLPISPLQNRVGCTNEGAL